MARRPAALVTGAVVLGAVVLAAVAGSRSTAPPLEPADPASVYDPTDGEPLPQGYRLALDRDQILPVYDPEFTDAAGVDWPADSLVIGIAGDDEAKAYPVTHLNSREMVLDTLDGDPILVSW